jgi:hypothetical protein
LPCWYELRWADIADRNEPVLPHKLRCFPMQKILAAVPYFGVDRLYLLAFAGPLQGRKFRRKNAGLSIFSPLDSVANVLVPRSMPILILMACVASATSTGTLMYQRPRESSENEPQPILAFCTVEEFQGLLIGRNPAKGAANTSCLAPIQPRLSVLLTRGVILFANLLHSLRVQIESCFWWRLWSDRSRSSVDGETPAFIRTPAKMLYAQFVSSLSTGPPPFLRSGTRQL